jgi:hypothetical protein
MRHRLMLLIPALFFLGATAHPQDTSALRKDITLVVKQGRGSATGRAAWERLIQAGPEALTLLLDAMSTEDIVPANWLRTAFDHIAERELRKDSKRIDADALLRFAKDPKRPGRARRLALELVEKLRPGTGARLYPAWLDDPEFRYEAVELTLQEARKLAKAKNVQAKGVFARALEASRDITQARQAAAGLLDFGVKVSVAQHLGFLTDWHLVGPFDAMGMKGFHTTYPPEKQVDLAAEYDGQGKKVRWKRYQAQEPPVTSGGRHQALVDLRSREALGDADDAVAFAYTEFTVATGGPVEFRGAADDNFTVYVNGKKEFGFEEYRNGVRHDRHRFRAVLKAGKNTVLVKVCQTPAPNPEPNWEFFLRAVDDTGKGIRMKNALPKPQGESSSPGGSQEPP